jgi:hypothetical protein
MDGRISFVRALCLLALIVVSGELLIAQDAPSVSVIVRSNDADRIPGVAVRIEHEGFSAEATTGSDGKASIPGLRSGEYRISVSAEGFEKSSQGITIQDERQEIEIEFTLVAKLQRTDSLDVLAEEEKLDVQTTSSAAAELRTQDIATLPLRPATVTEALVLVPGVNRNPSGEVSISGAGEERSALIVNSGDVTDPATGLFGSSVPVDSVESIEVLKTPFLAQYGRFTSGIVAVETKRGDDKWRFSIKEPVPDFRVRSKHIRGLRDATPRISFGGPLIKNRLFMWQSLQYKLEKKQSRTLSFPTNESKEESVNSFTQFDYFLSPTHFITGTAHVTPAHINFVDPQFFNPQPVTPSFRGREQKFTFTDHLTVSGELLDSSISRQDFDSRIGAQGDREMVFTPTGNTGNYYARRHRESSRLEWMETLSVNKGSAHAFKFGSVIDRMDSRGSFDFHPIQIQDSTQRTLERIEFLPSSPFNQSDTTEAVFAQDHWTAFPALSIDGGVRAEYQQRTSTLRIAPRAGAALTLFHERRVVIRGGFGFFYDRVPLGVYSFGRLPARIVTTFNPSGEPESVQQISNSMEVDQSGTGIVLRRTRRGNFAPYSRMWNIEAERMVAGFVRVRVNYQHSNSAGGILLMPRVVDGVESHALSGGGRSQYHQFEIAGTMRWSHGQQFVLSYIRSKALGDLNEFSRYLGNYPSGIVRPNRFTNLQGDLPNRFIAWGSINLPSKMKFAPIFEYRTGRPYALFDAGQRYVGMPYADKTRFRNYVDLDERLSRDFKVMPKATLRLSVSVLNALNHFNPLEVHANTDDPQFGTFFGHYKRRYRIDFEVLF